MLKNEAPEGSEEKVLPLAIPESGEYKVVIVGAATNTYTGLYSGSVSTNRINIRERIVNNNTDINPDASFTILLATVIPPHPAPTPSRLKMRQHCRCRCRHHSYRNSQDYSKKMETVPALLCLTARL